MPIFGPATRTARCFVPVQLVLLPVDRGGKIVVQHQLESFCEFLHVF